MRVAKWVVIAATLALSQVSARAVAAVYLPLSSGNVVHGATLHTSSSTTWLAMPRPAPPVLRAAHRPARKSLERSSERLAAKPTKRAKPSRRGRSSSHAKGAR